MRRLGIIAFAFLTISNGALAAESCGPWIPNTNGTSWRMCSDAQGQRYCELKQGSKTLRIVCP